MSFNCNGKLRITSGNEINYISNTVYDYSLTGTYNTIPNDGSAEAAYIETAPTFTIPLALVDKAVYEFKVKWKCKARLQAIQHSNTPTYFDSKQGYFFEDDGYSYVDWFEKIYVMRESSTLNYAYETTVIRTKTKYGHLGFVSSPSIGTSNISLVLNTATKPVPTLNGSNQVVLSPSTVLTRTYLATNGNQTSTNQITDHDILCKVRVSKIA